ncbi:hypothetical protein FISHEDRAFT_56209 [Fistulina hepatica ATCC 64428]|uniref:DH domain-containing protein n=1 Tax=Fistulina hepatica ATCC 64428 TaxID=1128425 RepID=A0A0D7AJM3_9AGAR|nr:hypothetical protein FISHEDRAFT_56209 [Fistulina hepatica ATCC 64428]
MVSFGFHRTPRKISLGAVMNKAPDQVQSLTDECDLVWSKMNNINGFYTYIYYLPPFQDADVVQHVFTMFQLGIPLCHLLDKLPKEKRIGTYMPADYNPDLLDSDGRREAARRRFTEFTNCPHAQAHIPGLVPLQEGDIEDDKSFRGFHKTIDNVLAIFKALGASAFKVDELFFELAKTKPEPLSPTEPDYGRKRAIGELVDGERVFIDDVRDLIHCQEYRDALVSSKVFTVEETEAMFPGIASVFEFGEWFLVMLEAERRKPDDHQHWGVLFEANLYQEKYFDAMFEYAALNPIAMDMLFQKNFHRIPAILPNVRLTKNELKACHSKPWQRIMRYAMILQQIHDYTKDPEQKKDMFLGIAVAQRVADRSNATKGRVENDFGLEDLFTGIDLYYRGTHWEQWSIVLHQAARVKMAAPFAEDPQWSVPWEELDAHGKRERDERYNKHVGAVREVLGGLLLHAKMRTSDTDTVHNHLFLFEHFILLCGSGVPNGARAHFRCQPLQIHTVIPRTKLTQLNLNMSSKVHHTTGLLGEYVLILEWLSADLVKKSVYTHYATADDRSDWVWHICEILSVYKSVHLSAIEDGIVNARVTTRVMDLFKDLEEKVTVRRLPWDATLRAPGLEALRSVTKATQVGIATWRADARRDLCSWRTHMSSLHRRAVSLPVLLSSATSCPVQQTRAPPKRSLSEPSLPAPPSPPQARDASFATRPLCSNRTVPAIPDDGISTMSVSPNFSILECLVLCEDSPMGISLPVNKSIRFTFDLTPRRQIWDDFRAAVHHALMDPVGLGTLPVRAEMRLLSLQSMQRGSLQLFPMSNEREFTDAWRPTLKKPGELFCVTATFAPELPNPTTDGGAKLWKKIFRPGLSGKHA